MYTRYWRRSPNKYNPDRRNKKDGINKERVKLVKGSVASVMASPFLSSSAAVAVHQCAGKCGKVRWAQWLSSGCNAAGTPEWGCGTRSPVSGAPARSVHRSSFPIDLQSSSSFWWCSGLDPIWAAVSPGDLCHSWDHWSWEEVLGSNIFDRGCLLTAAPWGSLSSEIEKEDGVSSWCVTCVHYVQPLCQKSWDA